MDIDKLLRELKYTKKKYREKKLETFETDIAAMIDDCVIAINELRADATSDTSDGFHTFNELYHHRAVLFSVICNQNSDRAWKSRRHEDGTMFEGMFIVGIDTREGQATYHYDMVPYWCMFNNVRELEKAPMWDGHTAEEALKRLLNGL